MTSAAIVEDKPTYGLVISEICQLNWGILTPESLVDVAWGYYYFSVQFRENLEIACDLFPEDKQLKQLKLEECNTDNLSPWPEVASVGERLDHDEFMRRLLKLSPISEEKRRSFEDLGDQYLRDVRNTSPLIRALSIASYEDGGLEMVFSAMLTSPRWEGSLLGAFRHFLSEHIRFDSDPDQGHGALSRHLRPDDRILPLWDGFKRLLVGFAPQLAKASD